MNNKAYPEKNGRFFYAMLALSIISAVAAAIGIGFTAKKIRTSNKEPMQTFVDWDNNSAVVSDTEANKLETGIPDDRTTEQVTDEPESETDETPQETTLAAATEQAKIECSLPLGTAILKDYSNGAMVKSKTMNDWRTHNGVDFTGEAGDDIRAVCGGTVIDITADSSWGNVITVEHENGLTAKYCGFDNVIVTAGERVARGDVLGSLGVIPIESADASHLHFEVMRDGKYLDPIDALSLSRDEE